MMSLTQYYPFDPNLPLTLREAMERMLEPEFSPMWSADLFAIGRGFPVDVYEDDARYVVEASMPGINPDELNVMASTSAITIRATTTHSEKPAKQAEQETNGKKAMKSGSFVRRERYHGEVTRVIDFPDAIVPDSIKATYTHGVLTLEAPKAGKGTPKTVTVTIKE